MLWNIIVCSLRRKTTSKRPYPVASATFYRGRRTLLPTMLMKCKLARNRIGPPRLFLGGKRIGWHSAFEQEPRKRSYVSGSGFLIHR